MAAEHEKARARYGQALNIAQFQKEQVGDKQHRRTLEKVEDVKEGLVIKEQYDAYQSAKDAINKQNREFKTVLMETYKNDIEVKKEVGSCVCRLTTMCDVNRGLLQGRIGQKFGKIRKSPRSNSNVLY